MRRLIFTFGCAALVFLFSPVVFGSGVGDPGASGASMAGYEQPQATDTIRLKNGSILHGLVTGFENGIFTVLIPGTQSRAMVHVNDVERIEFASDGAVSVGPSVPKSMPEQPASKTEAPQSAPLKQEGSQPQIQREEIKVPVAGPPRQEVNAAPASQAQKTEATQSPQRGPTTSPMAATEKGVAGSAPEKKGGGTTPAAREMTVSLSGREVWADTGLDVSRGDRLKLAATGRVNLSRNQATGPEGVNISDPQRMMPNRPTGGLIAVIGDDNDDFTFVGAAAEFVASRSGRLFLMVNENNLDDNSGTFSVRVQVQSPPKQ